MKLNLYNLNNESVGEVEVDEGVFGIEVKPHLHWEVVRGQLAARRRGTASTKNRANVKSSNKKPFRQKGTGRARQGQANAPGTVGGGTIFGPHPRSYEMKIPKKVKKAALRSTLSLLVKLDRLKVVEKFELPEIKTKLALHYLSNFNFPKGVVVDVANEKLNRSVRNLRDYKYLAGEGVNVYDSLKYGYMIITKDALLQIENRLKGSSQPAVTV